MRMLVARSDQLEPASVRPVGLFCWLTMTVVSGVVLSRMVKGALKVAVGVAPRLGGGDAVEAGGEAEVKVKEATSMPLPPMA